MKDPGPPTTVARRSRKWVTGVLIALVALIVLLAVTRAAFDIWRHSIVPDDAPEIAMSLDDTWLNDLGITRSTYEQALARAGGRLIAIEPDDAGDSGVEPERIRALLADKDGLLLTGGGDVDPELYGGDPADALDVNRHRDDFEIALIGEARRRGLPILGICRGCQILNVAHGGTLRNLRRDEDRREKHFGFSGHGVRLEPDSILAKVYGDTRLEGVVSFHGQAAGVPGDGVRVVARLEQTVTDR